ERLHLNGLCRIETRGSTRSHRMMAPRAVDRGMRASRPARASSPGPADRASLDFRHPTRFRRTVCGICGVVQLRGEPRPVIAPEVLDRMVDVMMHRGPNDRGTYLADGVALGVRRLSIVDVEGGHQPVSGEDGSIWAVQNGEL